MSAPSIYKSEQGRREIMALYDAVLARWPVPCRNQIVPTRHGETFVISSCGDPQAPHLVLLHGAASNAVSWVGDVAAYSRYFYVHAVDLPGEPGRSAPNRPSWHNLDFADWLSDVFDGLGIQSAALLGISQGGWTALRFAASFPLRVSRLVLLAPGGVVPTRPFFILRAVALSFLGRWGAERINRIVMGEQDLHPEAVRFMNAIMMHFNTRIEKEYIFRDKELLCLEMPALFVGGARDALFDIPAAAARLQRLHPRLTTTILPDAGHALVNLSDQVLPFLTQAGNPAILSCTS